MDGGMTKILNVSYTQTVQSKLPAAGVSIFSVMSRLAEDWRDQSRRRGFPISTARRELVEAVARYMREGHNQYAPMLGVSRFARRSRGRSSSVRPPLRPRDRDHRDVGRHRRPVQHADGAGAARRRGAAVPAGVRLVRAGRPAERRHPGVRHARAARTIASTGTRSGAPSRRGRASSW